MPYWLKGGLIGLGIGILLVLSSYFFAKNVPIVFLILSLPTSVIILLAFSIIDYISYYFFRTTVSGFIIGWDPHSTGVFFLSGLIGFVINCFLIGILMSWIYKKIKSK